MTQQSDSKAPVFIFGSQRSGTTMLQGILERSPGLQVFGESDSEAMDDYRLREIPVIEALVRERSPSRCLFKPICDSHYADHLLNAFPGSRAVWIYRDPVSVVRSGMKMWPGHYLEIRSRFLEADWGWLGWRAERLLPATRGRALELYGLDLTEAEAGAVLWFLRNQAFFDWHFDRSELVHVLRYEAVARDPRGELARMFGFMEAGFEPQFADAVHRGSARSGAGLEFRPEVRDVCNELIERLDRVAQEHRQRPV